MNASRLQYEDSNYLTDSSESDNESCAYGDHKRALAVCGMSSFDYIIRTLHDIANWPTFVDENAVHMIKRPWDIFEFERKGDEIMVMHYNRVKYIEQKNEDCGFVTVAMAASIAKKSLNVNAMIEWAKCVGLTEDGGLTIYHLKDVCRSVLNISAEIMDMPDKADMIADLMKGFCYFVGYYPRKGERGRPGPKNSESGHCGLIFGAYATVSRRDVISNIRKLNSSHELYFYEHNIDSPRIAFDNAGLMAIHGWSKGGDQWTYEELKASSSELFEPNRPQVLRFSVQEVLDGRARDSLLYLDETHLDDIHD